MADNETIADIVAMLRANARGDRFDGFSFTSLADRLEAAHRRERGDCAKLREALEHLLHGEYRDRCEVTNIAHSALAAPPRNCDRFATADEAIGAYRQTHKHMVVNVFLDWLFAPATEKEGGAK